MRYGTLKVSALCFSAAILTWAPLAQVHAAEGDAGGPATPTPATPAATTVAVQPAPAVAPAGEPLTLSAEESVVFVRSARKGDLAKIQAYLDKGVKPDEPRDANGNKAVGVAALDGRFDVVQALVKAGADCSGNILKYCSYHADVEIASFLVAHGAGKKQGELVAHETPLIFYTMQPAFRKLLAEKTATDPNLKFKGDTILINCIKLGMADVVQALIDRGADLEKKNDAGILPIDAAKSVAEKFPAVLKIVEDAVAKKSAPATPATPAAATATTPPTK